jgi:V/A-type H+-transporting ATPase subunit E
MSEELQSLLDKINADGIQKAEAEAAKIIADAKAEAAKIIAEAKNECEALCSKAASEAEAFKTRAVSAAGQAARDIALQLRADLSARLNAAVSASAAAALTPEFMAQLIKTLVEKFAASPEAELTVRCAVKDTAALDTALKGALADSIKTAPVMIASPEISAGVQVEFNDDDCCFDFSEAAVSELLAAYAGEQLSAVFKA